MNIKIPTTVASIVIAAALLTGCSVAAEPTPDPAASAASTPEQPAEPVVEEVNPLIKPFGEVITYEDGVSISVSAGAPFTPTEYAAGAESGNPIVFEVVITNNSEAPLEPTAYPTMSSGGQESTMIADVAHPKFGDVGMPPTTTLLPGQTVKFYTAFAVVDPADVTLEVSPSFDHDYAIFTTVK